MINSERKEIKKIVGMNSKKMREKVINCEKIREKRKKNIKEE